MNQRIEQMIQQIGCEAIEIAKGRKGRLLLYVYIDDGVISTNIFYQTAKEKVVLKFVSDEMDDLIYNFWEEYTKENNGHKFRVLNYIIELDNSMKMEMIYPDELPNNDDDLNLNGIRKIYTNKYFPGMEVDQSNPR